MILVWLSSRQGEEFLLCFAIREQRNELRDSCVLGVDVCRTIEHGSGGGLVNTHLPGQLACLERDRLIENVGARADVSSLSVSALRRAGWTFQPITLLFKASSGVRR